jgi:hypothetical protein
MGNFKGHWIPGTGLCIGGLMLLLKATNVSFLKSMRLSKFFLNMEPILKIVGSVIGFSIEYSDMVRENNYTQSHYDHLGILFAVFILGVLDLAHIHNLLRDPIWCMVSPAGFIFIGYRFNSHKQETDLRTNAHFINSMVLIAAGLSRAMEYLISMHTNRKYHVAVLKKEELGEPKVSGGILSRLFSVPADEVVTRVNSIYTNPQMYTTIFPMLTAFLIFFDGIWWWQMGVSLFLAPYNAEMENGHHGMVALNGMLTKDFMIFLIITGVISIVLHQIDRRFFPQKNHTMQLKLADDTAGLEFELTTDSFELQKFAIE